MRQKLTYGFLAALLAAMVIALSLGLLEQYHALLVVGVVVETIGIGTVLVFRWQRRSDEEFEDRIVDRVTIRVLNSLRRKSSAPIPTSSILDEEPSDLVDDRANREDILREEQTAAFHPLG